MIVYNVSPIVTDLIKTYEPFSPVPKNGLIGWGHKITGDEEIAETSSPISTARAEEFLAKDIYSASRRLNFVLARTPPLKQQEYDALLSLFLSSSNLNNSFLLKAVNSSNLEAIEKEFIKWGKYTASPERRAAEYRLFATGFFE